MGNEDTKNPVTPLDFSRMDQYLRNDSPVPLRRGLDREAAEIAQRVSFARNPQTPPLSPDLPPSDEQLEKYLRLSKQIMRTDARKFLLEFLAMRGRHITKHEKLGKTVGLSIGGIKHALRDFEGKGLIKRSKWVERGDQGGVIEVTPLGIEARNVLAAYYGAYKWPGARDTQPPSPSSRYIQPSDARQENPENSWSPSRSSMATVQLDGKDGRSETKDGRSEMLENTLISILKNPKLQAEWEKFRVIIDQVRVSMDGPSNNSSWTDANMLSLFFEFRKTMAIRVFMVSKGEEKRRVGRSSWTVQLGQNMDRPCQCLYPSYGNQRQRKTRGKGFKRQGNGPLIWTVQRIYFLYISYTTPIQLPYESTPVF
ncbi:MAG: hypothetical protein AB7F21_05480 [Desulfuromonadales bacterium]